MSIFGADRDIHSGYTIQVGSGASNNLWMNYKKGALTHTSTSGNSQTSSLWSRIMIVFKSDGLTTVVNDSDCNGNAACYGTGLLKGESDCDSD